MFLCNPQALLLFALFCLTTTCGVAAQYPTRPRAPGVAFRLTSDYGVAAMYLKDGTSVPVAQVQGSPGYQAFMRSSATSAPTQGSKLCQYFTPILDRVEPVLGLNRKSCLNADVANVAAVLATLKAAVESYLGTNICFAALNLDTLDPGKTDIAQKALGSIHLRQTHITARAAQSAVQAHKPDQQPGFIGEPEVTEEPLYMLAVDHSLHWFNVGLFKLDEGTVDPIEDFVNSPQIVETGQVGGIKDALNHFFANPPAGVKLPEQLHQVVVYGDDAKNEELRQLLTELLGVDQVRAAYFSSSVFDGVNHTAYAAHVRMDDVQFEMRVLAPPGCKWRSKLYSNDERTTEL
ncbi:hypothetical protein FB567DRAFT_111665 [Paraphoma chrysanthemicola]|uniref:Uncharacterized protein n=1 Tax=Paraphoma chrysanthemicola TaxID=798071 RepID=A0A8K0R1H8_9PLEO|nr:hypothetical protein FB567DRAFT_111665 [Paraphoma chrysanthemicola]